METCRNAANAAKVQIKPTSPLITACTRLPSLGTSGGPSPGPPWGLPLWPRTRGSDTRMMSSSIWIILSLRATKCWGPRVERSPPEPALSDTSQILQQVMNSTCYIWMRLKNFYDWTLKLDIVSVHHCSFPSGLLSLKVIDERSFHSLFSQL